jgi:hypothetical protein
MGMERSVPLFSSEGTSSGYLVAGILWALIFRMISYMTATRFDILAWVIMTLVVGTVLYLSWDVLKRRRFRNPVTDLDLIQLFEEVKRDLGKGEKVELWYRDIDRQVFISTSNPVFKAILFSESAIVDILAKREKGRVLLAREVLKIEKRSPLVGLFISLLGFTVFAFIESLAFFNMFETLLFSFGTSFLAVLTIGILGLLILVPLVVTRTKTDPIDETIENLYGVPPDTARMEVLVGLEVTENHMREAEKAGEEDLASHRRSALRKAAAVGTVSFLVSLAFFYGLWSSMGSMFVLPFTLLMSAVAGGGGFVIAFMAALVWPMMTGGGERNTSWDVELPFANELQQFLNRQTGFEGIMVRGVKSPYDENVGLVVLKLKEDYTEETVHAVLPHTLRDIRNVELLGPLILAEMKRDEIQQRERSVGFKFLGIGIPFLAIGIIWAITTGGAIGLLTSILPIFVIYFAIVAIPAGYMTYWRRRAIVESELEVAMRFPRYREALQILIEKHHMLPYGTTSYKSRLGLIDKQLGLSDQ